MSIELSTPFNLLSGTESALYTFHTKWWMGEGLSKTEAEEKARQKILQVRKLNKSLRRSGVKH
jgi:hypothetical protein